MNETYKDQALAEAEAILEELKGINEDDYKGVITLKAVIPHYNNWIKLITDGPKPSSVNLLDNSDISTDGYHSELSENGIKKLTEIRKTCNTYKHTHTPIPQNEVIGWSAKKFWRLTTFIVTSCITICAIVYQIGFSNGKSEMQRGYDAEKNSLSQKIDSLRTNYNIINDSLKACNINIISKNDSLKECNTNTIAKDDSISFLLSKNKQVNNNKKGSAK